MAIEEGPKKYATGKRHVFEVRCRWTGHCRSLIDDRTIEFTEFLPFRPRGAQLLLDPFEPKAGRIVITGRALSPARVLDPEAEVKAWCDGQPISVAPDGALEATTKLHAGSDQIHVRAQDTTQLAGRGYMGTWTPALEDDPSFLPLYARRGGVPPVRKPARYGRTRAEVQRFSIAPGLVGFDTIDLILKDEKGSELGRVPLKLKHENSLLSWTEWVCITATDPAADPPLDAIEGKILRVPSFGSTLELEVAGEKVGDPLRMSGLDPAKGPDALRELADPEQPGPLGIVLGGRYGLDDLNLRWLTATDADNVLLPGDFTPEGDETLKRVVDAKEAELAELDPVDLEKEEVRLPAGWAALDLDARETNDPWDHDDHVELVTYQQPSAADSPEPNDFVHSARQPRVLWHPEEEWAVNPDQVLVKLADGTADADVADLCRRKNLRVAGTVRRDSHVLLESPEPLDLVELEDLVKKLESESMCEAVTPNYIMMGEENVATVRAPDVMRSGALVAPQPGCYRPYDVLTLRHHLQTRAFPAQQILEHLRSQQVIQSQISLAITDNGFGNTSQPNISPDFSMPRLPWLGRLPGPGPAVAPPGIWGAFPASVGATLAFTNPGMIENPPPPMRDGHGTRTLHIMAGHGAPFRGLTATAPPLAPAAPIGNYVASPWCVGMAPMATVLPMRTIGVVGGTMFTSISAVRYAFLQGIEVVNTSAGLTSTLAVPANIAAGGNYNLLVTPMLNHARAIGGIWVVSGGNAWFPHNIHLHSAIAPAGARAVGSNPVVAVTPTSQTLLPALPVPGTYPLTFTNPWHSVETRALNSWPQIVAHFGPESTVSAPGDELNLRHFNLTAASVPLDSAFGSGTSFAAPQTAGLLGLMKLADRIMGRAVPRPGVATLEAGANRLIDLLCFTAHKGRPLFTAGEAGAQYSTVLGHGRIDAWAAVLSTLNDGPMFAGTAPHMNLVNTGTYVAPGNVLFWGLELDTPAFHARPWLVNIDTGAAEQVVDAMGLDPAIDAANPARPAWTYQVRAGGAGDRILPPSNHPGPTPSYMMQFTLRAAQLRNYSHLCFERGPNEPPIVATPGVADLDPGAPNLMYYGLPLRPLANHDVAGPTIAPFRVDMRHFIFKAHTNQHDRRLRVTFDRVEIRGAVVGGTVNVQWTVSGTASPVRAYDARTGGVVFLGGETHVLYHAENAPLPIRFDVAGLGSAAIAYLPPATPTAATHTPWGLGHRVLDVPGFRVHFRVEQEVNLPREWNLTLNSVRLLAPAAGSYLFAVESGGIRSPWGNRFAVFAPAPVMVVPITPPPVIARSPFVPNLPHQVVIRALHLGTMNSATTLPAAPASRALAAVEVLNLATAGAAAIQFDGTVQVGSNAIPQAFV